MVSSSKRGRQVHESGRDRNGLMTRWPKKWPEGMVRRVSISCDGFELKVKLFSTSKSSLWGSPSINHRHSALSVRRPLHPSSSGARLLSRCTVYPSRCGALVTFYISGRIPNRLTLYRWRSFCPAAHHTVPYAPTLQLRPDSQFVGRPSKINRPTTYLSSFIMF